MWCIAVERGGIGTSGRTLLTKGGSASNSEPLTRTAAISTTRAETGSSRVVSVSIATIAAA
jgi:hypothetical protein